MSVDSEEFKITPGKKVSLKDYDSSWVPEWAKKQEDNEGKKAVKEQALEVLETKRQKLIEMQELLWASDTYSMLIILQGMDAAGKDSTISHVMSGVNPQGCQVTSFKTPSEEELNHDFLWRHVKALPERGRIGIFNRSYYEDVLIVKVHPEILKNEKLPPERRTAASLGRHLDGCRIGFDLGGSDRKVAAVIEGKVVFSEETVWDPYRQPESLKKAAAHMPRVDAIGGSAAGVYVNNRVKVASLFRGVSPDVFDKRVKDLFLEIKKAWNNIPFEVVNDGEVTALAGSMSLGKNRVLGISLGTSTAGGYVNAEGNITSWINELAFVPVDYNPNAPTDEWSGDYGSDVQYFSQQCVGRLLDPAGIEVDSKLALPEKLKHVQKLMDQGDYRARKIYETIGTYLGYAVANFSDFYDLENILILGRVTSGPGGDIIIAGAKEVLKAEFPELTAKIAFHIPDEKDKRHGQAVAAASLPKLA